MKTLSAVDHRFFRYDAAIVLIIGTGFAAISVFASGLSPKWFIFISLLLIGISVLFIVPKREKAVLYGSILLLTIGLDFYPIYIETLPYSPPTAGFRITAYDIVFFFLFASWMIRVIVTRRASVRFFPSVSLPFAMLWVICLVNCMPSPLPGVLKISYLFYVLKNWLIFLYIANNVENKKTIYIVVAFFVASGVIQAVLAIAQYATSSTLGLELFGSTDKSYFAMKAGSGIVGRVAGTFGHPNKLAVFLSSLLSLCLALVLAPIRLRLKALVVPSLILIAVANVLTLSRGGWMNAAFAGTITLFWCLSRRTKSKILSGFLISFFILITFISTVAVVDSVRQRLFEEDFGSAFSRIPLAELALSMIRQNPLLGVGLGGFTAVAHRYDTTREAISYNFPAPVHNEFLLVASELGVPALILLLVILSTGFIKLFKLTRPGVESPISFLAIGFLGGWAGWILHQQIEYQYSILLAYPLWLLLGLVHAIGVVNREGIKS